MKTLKVILTGATGMVGEGVLLECLNNEQVNEVLVLGRRSCGIHHPKLKELIVPDFNQIDAHAEKLKGYDACFYCAGVSSIGKKEDEYSRITYDTTMAVAKTLVKLNPSMVFDFVTGAQTNAEGKMMWARVKGRTENDLMKLGFRGQYNFRPGAMTPVAGQKNVKAFFRPLIWLFSKLAPGSTLSLHEVGRAMIRTVTHGYEKQILEVHDIRKLGAAVRNT